MKPNLIEMLTQQKHSNSEYNPRKARKCPLCGETDLVLAERQGVEIDYCPKCRGIWLDRGELDKIIEKSVQVNAVPADTRAAAQPVSRENIDDRRDDKREKGGFLGDLFDF